MRKISLNHITKIEGHARLDLTVEDSKLVKCELGSIEGSRYFEGLLKGKKWYTVPEITSRICGICSSAHGVASVMAMENALGIKASEQTVTLRELQTIGERIRSHATHLYFLALPDYLGYESALEMAPKFKDEIQQALRLIKLGNDMVALISGRVMHQVATNIGHFTHFPSQSDLDELKKRLIDAKNDIFKTATLIASLELPSLDLQTPFLSLSRDDAYATSHGYAKIGNQKFEQHEYANFLKEYHEPYSNANFVVKDGKSYYAGALARLNNNYDFLSVEAKKFMESVGFKLPNHNPFYNNLSQGVELIHYWEECIKILGNFKIRHEEPPKFDVKAGHGIAMNEAPRGNLIHEYNINDDGYITYANIITPTAQFLRSIQDHIAAYVQKMLDTGRSEDKIKFEIEKLIRSYDPCFSCATHFLKVNWKRI